MSIEENVHAEQMEAALSGQRGFFYVTKQAHGRLPAGTPCRVWRTAGGTLQVRIKRTDMPEDAADAYDRRSGCKIGAAIIRISYLNNRWYLAEYEAPTDGWKPL